MAFGRRKNLAWIAGLLLSGLAQFTMAKSAADYYVSSLPGAPTDVPLLKMHAGHIEVTPEHHGNVFFWHFANRHLADRPRTIIWLNGGPGCSSEDGALMEIGPYRINPDGSLRLVDGSWDEFANVLFIDNPVGTGYSYVDGDSYVRELGEMANQLVKFLEQFFELFPHYSLDDIYIAGESYAGQHIPYLAQAILDRNKNSPEKKWNLEGLLIGNGWISGVDQYPSYLQYAYKYGLLTAGTPEAQQVERQQAICDKSLSNGGKDRVDDPSCEDVLQQILGATKTSENGKSMCYNMYDVRLKDEYPSCGMNWPPDLTQVTPYLRRREVTEALHVNKEKHAGWTECNGAVGSAFKARGSKPSKDLLPGLLEQIPIMLFSGEQDLICNHLGTEELINNLEFNGGKGFEISPGVWAPRRAWTFEGEPAGIYQEARNLTYVLIHNSSHMVPFDHPRRTRDMLDRFMGVDISSIGGKPTDSRIDGAKGPSTSVGAHPNSTMAEKETAAQLKAAEWKAYRRAGELALVVVSIAAGLWFYFVWRQRRKTRGYQGVMGGDPDDSRGSRGGIRLGNGKRSQGGAGDIEAADFAEHELEDLASDDDEKSRDRRDNGYAIGDGEDDSDEGGSSGVKGKSPMNGKG